ncbi:MAG TPA: NYN domain-containing protein, partial [Candidatus Limnocylindrales bacterium]
MGKNVAVFVDVANIFYAAKAAGVDIDYVTLLKSATAGRDFVRAYAYTGLDPDNENQRNFHQFLARHQYKVVSKDIRKYGDGKVKANLDIELVVDLMKTARNLDVAVIVSGDGDFASAIRAVQEMGVRCEVISFRGNTSSDLIDVADLFTDITHIAKVDKGSTRSGRRVAEDDDEDLSMTEVPDKMTEGTGRGRGRGRGRGGRYEREDAPVAARSSRTRSEVPMAAVGGSSSAGLVALPGEKLSRAAASMSEIEEPEELDEAVDGAVAGESEGEGDARRRRRRRGGRGRGRGRRDELGNAEGVESPEGALTEADLDAEDIEAEIAADAAESGEGEDADEAAEDEVTAPAAASSRGRSARATRTPSGDFATPFDDLEALATPRRPRSTPFGSVWDQQLGAPARPAASGPAPLPEDDEDLDEPEIPEYLLAERRNQGNRGGNRGGGGGRGGRNAAYAAAIDRERYGGGRGSTGSGINRYGESTRGGSSAGGGSTGGGNR